MSDRTAKATFGVLALVAALALSASLGKSIWTDEAASMYSAHLSWGALWQQSHVVDRVLLPYYALLHVWLTVSSSLQWARLLSLLAYALTVFLVGCLGYRLRGYWCGVAAVILCATNPLMVQGALDARPYALSALTATVSVALLMRWCEGDDDGGLWWFAIAAIATLALQLFAVLAPLAALASVVALRPARIRRRWRHVVAPVGLLLAASVAVAALTVGQRGQINWVHSLSGRAFVGALSGPASSDSHVAGLLYTLVVIATVLAVAFAIIRSWGDFVTGLTRSDVDRFAPILCWAAVPTILLVVVTIVKPVYVNRYVTASAPGLAVALAMLVAHACEVRSSPVPQRQIVERSGAVAIVLVLIFGAVVASRFLEERVKQASSYLASQVGQSGVVAYPNPLNAEEFGIYLAPASVHPALWPQIDNPRSFNQLDLRHGASTVSNGATNVWIATDSSNVKDTREFVKILKNSGYQLVASRDFTGSISVYIDHYRR